MKVVILVNNFGPYHIARVTAFTKEFTGEVVPIQLASHERLREWSTESKDLSVITLQNNFLEDSQKGKLKRGLISFLEEQDPDCLAITGYSHPVMRAAADWAYKKGKLSVLLSDSQYIDKPRRFIKEWIKGWWISKKFDGAFVGGANSAHYLETLGFPRNMIWRGYNVVDNEFYSRSAAEMLNESDSKREQLGVTSAHFLYVGRFAPEKNLIRLLEGYKRYLQITSQEGWELVFLGGGPQEKEIKDKIKELELDRITCFGFRNIHELPAYYAYASCLILPSTSETWGLVVNEAMACGLPVVVSERCGCVPDLVFPGINGFTFDPYDIDDMVYCMCRMSSGDVDLDAMGEASKRIIANYTPETWAKSLSDCVIALSEKQFCR